MSNSIIPVLIIGAGPTGLTLAVELSRHNIPYRIIDKKSQPVVTSNALVAQTRTLEVWEDMGLLQHAFSRGNLIHAMNLYEQNKTLASINFELLNSLYPFVLGISQHETETMLIEYLGQKGISVGMEVELIDFIKRDEGISVTLQHTGGETENINAQYLIACDGGHSLIRNKLNLSFRGKDLEQHFVMADFDFQSTLEKDAGSIFVSPQGPLIFIKYNQKYARMIAEVSKDPELYSATSLTDEQINRLLCERCPVEIKITNPIWTSGFWIHERIISTYRHQNIFFAGDAAHIHSPIGGQGMNTGIQDAYNLAWKLALVIKQQAKPAILASYHDERYPIAKAVLKGTTAMTHIMTLHNSFLQKIRNSIISLAMKSTKIRQKIVNTITQLNICYKHSLLTKNNIGNYLAPKAGSRLIDVKFYSSRLFDYVKGTQFCLLIFSGINTKLNETKLAELRSSIQVKFPQLIKFILITTDENKFPQWKEEKIADRDRVIHQSYHVNNASLFLIRPDKYIGFSGKVENGQQLIDYLKNIFFIKE